MYSPRLSELLRCICMGIVFLQVYLAVVFGHVDPSIKHALLDWPLSSAPALDDAKAGQESDRHPFLQVVGTPDNPGKSAVTEVHVLER